MYKLTIAQAITHAYNAVYGEGGGALIKGKVCGKEWCWERLGRGRRVLLALT